MIVLLDSGPLGLIRNPREKEEPLAAQALTVDAAAWGQPDQAVMIATMNVGHLARFTPAQLWSEIEP